MVTEVKTIYNFVKARKYNRSNNASLCSLWFRTGFPEKPVLYKQGCLVIKIICD